jgi:hypothetical protein
VQEQQSAQANLVASLGRESQADMASLMARYGSQLALAGGMAGTQTPLVAPATSKA